MKIYYTNFKTYNMIIKNNTNSLQENLNRTNVIYKFTCPLRHNSAVPSCMDEKHNYIAISSTTLKKD